MIKRMPVILRKCRAVLLLLMIFQTALLLSGRADAAQPGQRETAIEWFFNGEYEKALPLFTRLSYDFPYDYMLKYFTGASLVETGNFGLDAEKNLLMASARDVPARVYYFLGKLYHANNNWNSAQRYYNRFRNNADSMQIAELNTEELIQLCFRKINPFVVHKAEPEQISGTEPVWTEFREAAGTMAGKKELPPLQVVEETAGRYSVPGTGKGSPLTPGDTLDLKVSAEGKPQPAFQDSCLKAPGTAIMEASSMNAAGMKEDEIAARPGFGAEYQPGLLPEEKGSGKDAEADRVKAEQFPVPEGRHPAAGGTEMPEPEPQPAPGHPQSAVETKPAAAGEDTDIKDIQEASSENVYIDFPVTGNITYQIREMFQEKEALAAYEAGRAGERLLDSLLEQTCALRKDFQEERNPMLREKIAERIRKQELDNILLKNRVAENYRLAGQLEENWWKEADFASKVRFQEISDSIRELRFPAPVAVEALFTLPADTLTAIPADTLQVLPADTLLAAPGPAVSVPPGEEIPEKDEILYKIQLGAYNAGIPAQKKELFGRIAKLRTIDTHQDEKGNTVYTTGSLRVFADAVKLQTQVRQEGIKDAFVIATRNGKRIPLPSNSSATNR